jgi:hypothetical protein
VSDILSVKFPCGGDHLIIVLGAPLSGKDMHYLFHWRSCGVLPLDHTQIGKLCVNCYSRFKGLQKFAS